MPEQNRTQPPPTRPAGEEATVMPTVGATVLGPQAPSVTPTGGTVVPSTDSLIGPYRLVRKLGEGGMGTVWEAEHTRLKKKVAVKLLSAHLVARPEAVVRFTREMEAAGRVEHPHVVQAFDAGEAGGLHYLAMQYVEGSDLARLVAQRGPLSVVQACRAARQAALGLAAAHAKGLVHRDVKPQNLLVSKDGKVKLLDLGLAKLAEEAAVDATAAGITAAGQVMGTPDYMAPEQWEDVRSAGIPADLYALGCTLHFLLTGKPPFAHHLSLAKKMQAHLAEPAPSLRGARPDAPEGLDVLCARLLTKDPKGRLASAKELADVLAPFCGEARSGGVATVAEAAFPTFEPPPATVPGAKPKPRPLPVAGGAPPNRPKRIALAAAGGLGGLGMLGVVFALTLDFGDATLRIEGLDPEVKVAVSRGGELIEILDETTGAVAELDPGTYDLELRPGKSGEGLTAKLSKETVTLKRGGDEVVRVVKAAKGEPVEPPAAVGGAPAAETGDPHRDVALWLLREGIVVNILKESDGKEAMIGWAPHLPRGPFRVIGVKAPDTASEDDLERVIRLQEVDSLDLVGPMKAGRMTTEALRRLATMKSVDALQVLGPTTRSGLDDIAAVPGLQRLTVRGPTLGVGEIIAAFPKLKQLRVFESTVTADELASLRTMARLDVFGLNADQLTPEVADRIAESPTLSALTVYYGSGQAVDWGAIGPRLKNVDWLNILGSSEGDHLRRELEGLRSLPALSALTIDRTPIKDADVEALSKLTRLTSLWNRASGAKLTRQGLERLETALPRCRFEVNTAARPAADVPSAADAERHREVAVWASAKGGSVEARVTADGRSVAIRSPTDLPAEPFQVTALTVPYSATDDDMKRISQLGEIRALSLGSSMKAGRISPVGLQALATMRQIKELNTEGPMANAELEAVAAIAGLTVLRWQQAAFDEADFKALAAASGLTYVTLHGPMISGRVRVVAETLPKLTHLQLLKAALTPDDLTALSDFPGLKEFGLDAASLDPEVAGRLAALPKLKSLFVSYSEARAVDWRAVGPRLPRVDWLHLSDSPGGEHLRSEIVSLREFASLRDLSLYRTPVTDADVETFSGLSRLKRLRIYGAAPKLTPEGSARLKAALPGCTVEAETTR